jgi:saccharopine dehydrogenase-like NADP-dependent oxidoreductase
MTNILILGAHGQIARVATGLFLKRTDARLTLYLRNARRIKVAEGGQLWMPLTKIFGPPGI